MNIIDSLNDEEKKCVFFANFNESEVIFHENEICNVIGFLIEGKIKISSFNSNGREIIFNELKENDIFGNNLVFSDNKEFKGDVISLTKSRIAFIKKSDLTRLLSKNSHFLELFLNYEANFTKQLNQRINLLSFKNAEDRLIYYLECNNKILHYKSIKQLAIDLQLERETLSRLIYKLIKKGKITKENKVIKL